MTSPERRIREYLACSRPETELYGSRKGKVVVCGSGHTLWEDLVEIGFVPTKWKQNFDIIAVNRAMMDIPSTIDFGYSNHMDKGLQWAVARDEAYLHKDKKHGHNITLHSNREYTRTQKWPLPGAGTSGLNAVMLACFLGYEEIKVCGIPIDNGPHYYDPSWFTWNHFQGPHYEDRMMEVGAVPAAEENGILRPWVKFLREFKDIVEPMSGNPRRIWLDLTRE